MLRKKMTLIAYVFLKWQTARFVIRQMSKKPNLRTPFNNGHVEGSQTHVKSAWQHICQFFSWLWGRLTWKMFLLVICKILGYFVNTLNVHDKYCLGNGEILSQPVQMQLSNKQSFSQFFAPHLKSGSVFEHFEKKTALSAYTFPKLWIAKDVIRQTFKRPCFRTPFQSQHGTFTMLTLEGCSETGSQTLLQSPQQHLYHIFSSLRGIMSWEISLLVICEILGVLVKKLTVNNKYFLRNSRNLPQTNSNAII